MAVAENQGPHLVPFGGYKEALRMLRMLRMVSLYQSIRTSSRMFRIEE
jgi:hypothetical protein